MDAQKSDQLWTALLLGDASFPGGSLANSQGLESAMAHGLVNKHDPTTLQRYISISLEQATHQFLPFMRTAHQMSRSCADRISDDNAIVTRFSPVASDNKPKILEVDFSKSFYALDKYCHAFLSNDVSRRASINQGRCLLKVIRESYPNVASALDQQQLLFTQHHSSPSPQRNVKMFQYCHHAPIFGLLCGLLELPLDITDMLFLRMFLRDLVSAAVRLSAAGPIEGVHIQAERSAQMHRLLVLSRNEAPLPDSMTDIQYANESNNSNNGSSSSSSDNGNKYSNSATTTKTNDDDDDDDDDDGFLNFSIRGLTDNTLARTSQSADRGCDCRSASATSVCFYKDMVPIQTAPILDTLQSRQDLLYTRLFSS